jgi:hypothetical protein
MATTERHTGQHTYRVVTPMDDHGTMHVRSSGEAYEVVDYVDTLVRNRLSDVPAGSAVRLELTPVPGRDGAYAATRVLPGAPGVGV